MNLISKLNIVLEKEYEFIYVDHKNYNGFDIIYGRIDEK